MIRGNSDDVLSGEGGRDILTGDAGNDRILGGAGDDALSGEQGSDVFVFATGDGIDTVVDFTAGTDRIDLSAVAAIADLADLDANHAIQDGCDLSIEGAGGDRIVLIGVALDGLEIAGFLF